MPSASLNLIWMGISPHFIQFCFVTDVSMINYYTYATSVESKLLPCAIWRYLLFSSTLNALVFLGGWGKMCAFFFCKLDLKHYLLNIFNGEFKCGNEILPHSSLTNRNLWKFLNWAQRFNFLDFLWHQMSINQKRNII